MAGVVWSQGRGNPTTGRPRPAMRSERRGCGTTSTSRSRHGAARIRAAMEDEARKSGPTRCLADPGVVTSAVNLFTPVSTIAGPSNVIFAVDNDTGNVFWTRRFDGALPPGTAACPGGISGAPTRMVNLVIPPPGPARGGGGEAAAPTAVPSANRAPACRIPPPTRRRRGGGGRGGAGAAAPRRSASRRTALQVSRRRPAAPRQPRRPAPPSPFPTNAAAVARQAVRGGGLFRSSGVVYWSAPTACSARSASYPGKDVQRPAPFLPAGARFSDLIAVGEWSTRRQARDAAARATASGRSTPTETPRRSCHGRPTAAIPSGRSRSRQRGR